MIGHAANAGAYGFFVTAVPTTLLEIGRRYRVDTLAPGETGARGTGTVRFLSDRGVGSRRRKRSRPDSSAQGPSASHPGAPCRMSTNRDRQQSALDNARRSLHKSVAQSLRLTCRRWAESYDGIWPVGEKPELFREVGGHGSRAADPGPL